MIRTVVGAAAASERHYVIQQMSDPRKNDPKPLHYARRTSAPSERNAWIGLIITLAFCLAAAIVYLARHP